MIAFSRKIVNKNIKQKGPSVELFGTPDNIDKGEENFPKIIKKESLVGK
jgi:hypothetical protein